MDTLVKKTKSENFKDQAMAFEVLVNYHNYQARQRSTFSSAEDSMRDRQMD